MYKYIIKNIEESTDHSFNLITEKYIELIDDYYSALFRFSRITGIVILLIIFLTILPDELRWPSSFAANMPSDVGNICCCIVIPVNQPSIAPWICAPLESICVDHLSFSVVPEDVLQLSSTAMAELRGVGFIYTVDSVPASEKEIPNLPRARGCWSVPLECGSLPVIGSPHDHDPFWLSEVLLELSEKVRIPLLLRHPPSKSEFSDFLARVEFKQLPLQDRLLQEGLFVRL